MKAFYRLEIELAERPSWAKTRLSKELSISISAINRILREKKAGYWTMAKYTDWFNKAFNTNFTEDYLFEIIEIENGE